MSIAFGFIGEFILRRSDEVGHENWGKAISCDPPQHFPDIKYYWSRDYFPNFVEEDRRVMVRGHKLNYNQLQFTIAITTLMILNS